VDGDRILHPAGVAAGAVMLLVTLVAAADKGARAID
jgi:hypothetical protein